MGITGKDNVLMTLENNEDTSETNPNKPIEVICHVIAIQIKLIKHRSPLAGSRVMSPGFNPLLCNENIRDQGRGYESCRYSLEEKAHPWNIHLIKTKATDVMDIKCLNNMMSDHGIYSRERVTSDRGKRRVIDSLKRSMQVDDGTAQYYLSISDGDPRAAVSQFSSDTRWERQAGLA
ncbi:hypothetical protein CCACVL1_15182 [Corchorus capsularis]|uniref:Uncharacterized protein n=1 Tax=Corchorus capsularis TaxID=210143 RepID=A0A1R3I3L7_COCAP|nr:hypothetical protein CCACVL1_15182 [Corchorus capsularis]